MALRRDGAALVDGALGGAGATVAMSVLMLAARGMGLMGHLPPEKITTKAFGNGRLSRAQRGVMAALLHLGFGAAAGIPFALLRRRRRLPLGAAPAGVVYASLIWAVSYKGWIPALDIMPPPERDRSDRQVVMLLAHWVYGWTLGAILATRHP